MNSLEPLPEETDWGKARANWLFWKDKCLRLLELSNHLKTEHEKESFLIVRGGKVIQEIRNKDPAPNESDVLNEFGEIPVFGNLLKRCDYHYGSAGGSTLPDIVVFRNIKQSDDESFAKFASRIREAASLCNFTSRQEEIKLQIMSGAIHGEKLAMQNVFKPMTLTELEQVGNDLEATKKMYDKKEKREEPLEPVYTVENFGDQRCNHRNGYRKRERSTPYSRVRSSAHK